MSTNNVSFSEKKISELVLSGQRVLGGFDGEPDYKTRMVIHGYDDPAFLEIDEALTPTKRLSGEYLEARQKKKAKVKKTNAARSASKAHYAYLKRRIRQRCRGDKELLDELGIPGRIEQRYIGYYNQTGMFYSVALNDPEVAAKLAAIGITPEALQIGVDLLATFKTLWDESEAAKGECQRLVEARDQAAKHLQALISALVVTAKMEFRDTPQALEKLGIFVRNASPKRKKTAVEPGGNEPGGNEPGNTDPGTTEPGGTEPGGTEPGGTEPGNTEPAATEPAARTRIA